MEGGDGYLAGEDTDGRSLTGMVGALCVGVREPCVGHGPAEQDARQPSRSCGLAPLRLRASARCRPFPEADLPFVSSVAYFCLPDIVASFALSFCVEGLLSPRGTFPSDSASGATPLPFQW